MSIYETENKALKFRLKFSVVQFHLAFWDCLHHVSDKYISLKAPP